jgi:hypothetical protein
MSEAIMDKEDTLIEGMSTIVNTNHGRREKMLDKLLPAVDALDYDALNNMKASDRESVMGVISTADSVMKSQESAQEKKVKIHLQKKSDDVSANSAEVVLEMLKKINPASAALLSSGNADVPAELQKADEEIDRIAEDECEDITVDEMADTK